MKPLFTSVLLALVISSQGEAAPKSKKAQQKAKPAPVAKKTVGDLLKSITDAKLGKDTIKKGAAALPEFKAQGAAPRQVTEIKPPSSKDILRDADSDEGKLESITDQGIAQLYKLTQQYAKSKNRGELWLRLAEHYVEKAKYIEYRIQKEYDEKLNLYQEKKGPRPRLDLSKSREYNLKAIKLYEWFVRDFPKDPKMDQALFFLGYNHIELEQVKKGIGYYQQLTKLFPNSPFVGEAHFATGEYYFDNDKWSEAYKAFSEVLKNRRARLYTFALYKMAWCQYRMGKVGAGLKSLELVVKISRGPEQGEAGRKPVSRIRLGGEALKDIVLFYSDSGDYRLASGYFTEIGGEKATNVMLEKLAYLYADQGKKDSAKYVFEQLLQVNPTAPKAFDYQYQIVSIFATSQNQGLYRKELYQWIDNFGPESEWAKANAQNKKLLEDSEALREQALRNYTLLLHKNGQNSQKRPDLMLAKQAYQLYLGKFASSPKSIEMRFFYAELLYSLNEFNPAAKEYKYVAEKEPKGKYFDLALLNTVLAFERTLRSDDDIKKLVGESNQVVPFGPQEAAFVEAANKYVASNPKGEKVVEVKFKMGRLYYAFNHFDEALQVFREIVIQKPKSPQAVFAANLILDIYNIRKDYEGLAKEGTAMMKNRDLLASGFSTDVKSIVEKAGLKKGYELELKKDFAGAAKVYSDFVKSYPSSPMALVSAYNAGINFERALNFSEAIGMYVVVGGIAAKSTDKEAAKIKQKSLLLVGRLYEQTAQFEKAAHAFEKYAKENPKDPVTPDLYFNIAVIWESQKEWYKAIAAYEKYYDTTRKKDRTVALYNIASIHEKLKHNKAATEGYQRYLSSGGNDPEKVVEANFKIADFEKRRGKMAEAEKQYLRTISVQRAVSKDKAYGAMYAAEAKFILTEKIYQEFSAVRIPANPAKQAEAIKRKIALLQQLSNAMAAVIKYDDGNMVVASLTRLGQAKKQIATAIEKAPIPSGLTKEESENYKKGVEAIYKPFEKEALESFASAIQKSYDINFYSEWTKIALDEMAIYDPEKYAAPMEVALPSSKTDDMGVSL